MSRRNEISIDYKNEERTDGRLRRIVFSILFEVLFAAEVFLPMHDYLLFVIAVALSAGISVLMQLLSGHKWVRIGMVVAVAAGSVVTVLFFSKQWINGATIMLNSVIENWNSKNGTIYYLYVTGDTNVMVSKILFGLTMAAAAALLVNILLVIRWYSAVMMVNFAFFAYCVITSTSSVIWAIVSVCAVTLAYIALIDTDGWLIKKSKLYWLIVSIGVVMIAAGIFVAVRFIPEKNVEAMRGKVVRQIENQVYGRSDLCEGNLKDIPNPDDTKRVRLSVETDCKDALYFKGYVGAKYTGDQWTDLDKEAYQGENKDLQQFLLDERYSPQTTLAMFFSLSDLFKDSTYDVEEVKYTVENVSASKKYIYMPYTCQRGGFKYYNNLNRDLNAMNSLVSPLKTYSFSCLEIGTSEYQGLYNNGCLTDGYALEANQEILNYEQAYHDYADKYYRDVPDDVRAYFDGHLTEKKIDGAEDAIIYVRKYLRENIVYTENPKYNYSGDGDFIIELLEKNKQGHSVHYATAATMMLRYYGIPARYVEGYRRAATGAKKTSLYQKDAHAWVEIYRYGMGWVPIDVTPGYYDDEKSQTPPVMDQSYTPPETPETQGTYTNNSDGGNPPPQENDADDAPHPVLRTLWWLLLLLLLIIIIIIVRRQIILRKQRKRIQSDDWQDSILFMAGLMWRLCDRGGIDMDRTKPWDFRDNMNENFEQESKIDFKKVTGILNRVKYSNMQKDDDDYIVVRAYMDVVRTDVYRNAGFARKLRLKYIDVLC